MTNYWVGWVIIGQNMGLFDVSGNLDKFGGVLFFGGKINYFVGMGGTTPLPPGENSTEIINILVDPFP